MRNSSLTLMLVMWALVAGASVASGQDVGVRTGLAVVPGAAFDSADTGPSIGGAITVELSSRFAVEGSGTYVDRGAGATALNIQAGVVAYLITSNARVLPFIAAAAAVYRASFDLTAQQFFGGTGARFGAGASLCGGTGVCPYGNMPAFYGRRLGAMNTPGIGGTWPTTTFPDPAVHLGGGVRINVTPNVFIRPEVRGLFVVADNAVQSLGAVSAAFGYRF